MNGAVRVRYPVDRAIERRGATRANPADHASSTGWCRTAGRAAAAGDRRDPRHGDRAMTGIVPTNTLGAGKMIEELKHRGLCRRHRRRLGCREILRRTGREHEKGGLQKDAIDRAEVIEKARLAKDAIIARCCRQSCSKRCASIRRCRRVSSATRRRPRPSPGAGFPRALVLGGRNGVGVA